MGVAQTASDVIGRTVRRAERKKAPPPTSHATRIRYLDGWRGISILAVLAGHFLVERQVSWLGALGVELFFVLSGRLMADILFVERFNLPEFYKRRISRIFPGLAAFVLITWAATRGTPLAFKLPAVATALTFTINYALVLKHGVAAIENLWSLCIEEHAYLLLGITAFFARRTALKPIWILLGVAALSIGDAAVSTLVLRQGYFTVYWRTDAHLASIFLAGAAYLTLRKRAVPAWTPLAAFAAALAVMAIGPDVVRYSLGTGLLALSVATIDRAPQAVRAALSWRGLTAAGVWSYSVYLWQQPFFRLEYDHRMPAFAALAIAVACGLASFFLVEQPARRWLNANWKLPGARRAAPPAQTAAAPPAA